MRSRFLVFSLCALCVLCGEISAQDFKTLKDGIEYAEVTKEISGLKVNMNLLRLDLTKVRLDVHHAMDAAIGTEKTSSIATRHGAFAAINAGFFRLDSSIWAGDPAGVLMIDGKLWSESQNNRASLTITNGNKKTEVVIGHFTASIFVGYDTDVVNQFSGVNRERKAGEMILYTPSFGKSTLTPNDGTEIIFRKCSAHSCRKVQFVKENGNSMIPDDGYVISIAPKPTERQISLIKSMKNISTELSPEPILIHTQLGSFEGGKNIDTPVLPEDITNGVPQLIKNGKIDITWQEEKSSKSFVETRHPRTAVAKLKDGKFLMITVDGRTESSGGIGLQDLAEYLFSLGATDAMNLDGGGSTTMFVDGKVVNHPSDKEGERKISDVILVTPRIKKK